MKPVYWVIPGILRDQNHTTIQVTLKDGQVFYIDGGIIMSNWLGEATGGHFSQKPDMPSNWYPAGGSPAPQPVLEGPPFLGISPNPWSKGGA